MGYFLWWALVLLCLWGMFRLISEDVGVSLKIRKQLIEIDPYGKPWWTYCWQGWVTTLLLSMVLLAIILVLLPQLL